jgi:hypothetical protein
MAEDDTPKPCEEAVPATDDCPAPNGSPAGIAPDHFARTILNPAFNSAVALQGVIPPVGEVLDVHALADELEAQSRAASEGNLARHEALLTAHAHTLDGLFTQLLVQAEVNVQHSLPRTEAYLRLALKAQSQCRTTIEALAAMKRPPLVIAQQANLANGPQQVNNGVAGQPGEIGKRPNELLEVIHGERLDPGAAGAAGSPDTCLEAVAAIHGAKDPGGEG